VRISILTIFAAILLSLLLHPANANTLSFAVEPMTSEVTAKAGAQHTGVITVRHQGSPALPGAEAIRLRIYAMDWSLNRQGAPEFLKPGAVAGSCSAWVRFNPVEVTLSPGEARPVRFTIDIPAGAQGTFHTVIMFESAPKPARVGQQVVGLNGRIGSTVYVHVGPSVKRARVTQFSLSPTNGNLTIENTGTSHVRLKGTLQFRDETGRMVQQVPLPGAVILPGKNNVRDLALEVPKTLRSGKYQVTALLDYGGEVLLGARAHVTMP
jgi:hypothetical protein